MICNVARHMVETKEVTGLWHNLLNCRHQSSTPIREDRLGSPTGYLEVALKHPRVRLSIFEDVK